MTHTQFARIGWRARIALIKPAAGYADIAGFHRMAPEGVAITATVINKPIQQTNAERLEKSGDYVVDAVKILSPGKPDVIMWSCTSGSFIKGYGYDQELTRRMEDTTAIRATTTTTAVLAALRKLEIMKICLVTLYIDEVNDIEKQFLEDEGFDVVSCHGLQILESLDIPDVPPFEMYQFTKSVCSSDADGIFISCTALDVVDIIELLEYDFEKPVITSNQASFWHALQIAKVKEPIQGYGELPRVKCSL